MLSISHLEAALMDEAGRDRRLLGAAPNIWVPPRVTSFRAALTKPGEVRARFLRYGVPSAWPPVITGERPEATTWALEEAGWRSLEQPGDLLSSAIRLAEEDRPQQQTRRVRAFAAHFGPLWRCLEHGGHFWSSTCQPRHARQPCRWAPLEPVSAFLEEARHARAVLQSAQLLETGTPVPRELASGLRYMDEADAVEGQRARLIFEVRVRLRELEAWHIAPIWQDEGAPQIQMGSGVGFLPLLWVELVQAICKAHRLVQCSRCQEWYVRATRLQAGRANYCPACGPNAARNTSAQRRRERERRVPATP